MPSILSHLLKAVRSAAAFNPEIQVAPACILWPDGDRQWEAVIPMLQAELPELLILGDYAPEKRSGPAIWLRCVLAGQIEGVLLPEDRTPILYLPGASRQDLRAVETCPDHLKPLADLQYRGVIWSQINAKDWTILAWLKSDQGGLGLDVAQDNDAKQAMRIALHRLLDEDLSLLQGKRLDKDYFHSLLMGGDLFRDLLQWLDQGEAFQVARDENQWRAFVEVCKSQLAFNPQDEGVLAGADRLAYHEDPWLPVWNRYCEAPNRYPHIPARIRKCRPPRDSLLWHGGPEHVEGWPQWNEEQEAILQRELLALAHLPAHEARQKLAVLEKQHGLRRSLVWAELGESPLALALEHLASLAELTRNALTAGTVEDLMNGYCHEGWRADDQALRALALVNKNDEFSAVSSAVRAVYLPWLEDSARYLQNLLEKMPYPGGDYLTAASTDFQAGDCLLFVDGLRFDTGKRLAALLEEQGFTSREEAVWAALPTVTASGKPAVSPVRDKIQGGDESRDFEPVTVDSGQSLKGGYHLKRLLTEAGWTILDRASNGNGQGMAWCEFGDIDQEGHKRGWKLAKYLDSLLREVVERISALLGAGWKRVQVVTDHGWLLLPGELPKIDLPASLTEGKWGRCAALKSGALAGVKSYPWYWNPQLFFALADGVSCFKKGEEYAHGALSLQECLTLRLTVTGNATRADAEITDIAWKGLRCTVSVTGESAGLSLDIRLGAGDALSSVLEDIKVLKSKGTASVVVENEDLEGQEATLVLLDKQGSPIAQQGIIIGGGA